MITATRTAGVANRHFQFVLHANSDIGVRVGVSLRRDELYKASGSLVPFGLGTVTTIKTLTGMNCS